MKYDYLLHSLGLIIVNNQLFLEREREREIFILIWFLGLGI